MPEWVTNLTIGEIIVFLTGSVVAGGFIMRIWKPVRRIFVGVEAFIQDWNGIPARKDLSGREIEPAKPGVLASIEVLREQLENSHQNSPFPNLREDLDTKASKEDVAALTVALNAHMSETADWAPMLRDLHAKWAAPDKPPE